jgi:hypothetical protein
MKAANSVEHLRRKRAAMRRRDKAALRTGKATRQQLQKQNSWFSSRKAIRFDARSLAAALSKAP